MRLHYFFCFFFFYAAHAIEYMYPVACLDGETILYIHQINPTDIQLYSWNYVNDIHEQMLWSLYNPAAVQLLPNKKGFSFLDNGRLRITLFEKRSPKAIDFDEPIFNINKLQWLDEHTCYCSAQYGNHFSLFQLHDDGRVEWLLRSNESDCMYPCKVNDSLFFIERCINGASHEFNYAIKKTIYGTNNPELVLRFYDQPIIFLNMISEHEGFVVGHEKSIDDNAQKAYFQYHHIKKEDDAWKKTCLFSFAIPTNLFLYDNENHLFESILPLLPRIIDGVIYFINCSHSKNNYLEIYCCDMKIGLINKCIAARKGHLFVPLQCRERLFVGGGTQVSTATFPLFLF